MRELYNFLCKYFESIILGLLVLAIFVIVPYVINYYLGHCRRWVSFLGNYVGSALSILVTSLITLYVFYRQIKHSNTILKKSINSQRKNSIDSAIAVEDYKICNYVIRNIDYLGIHMNRLYVELSYTINDDKEDRDGTVKVTYMRHIFSDFSLDFGYSLNIKNYLKILRIDEFNNNDSKLLMKCFKSFLKMMKKINSIFNNSIYMSYEDNCEDTFYNSIGKCMKLSFDARKVLFYKLPGKMIKVRNYIVSKDKNYFKAK